MIINSRPAKIGSNIGARTEKHGEDDVPAFDIPLEMILLAKVELIDFRKDSSVWDRWFNERRDGLPEPADADLKPFCVKAKYEHCTASIKVGLNDRLFTFEDCDISKITLTPCVGGTTELCCTIQALITDENTALFEYMAKDATVELMLGKLEEKKNPAQPELNLDASGGEPEKPKRARKTKNGAADQPGAPA